MLLGELGRWNSPAAAVRPDLVVVLPPHGNDRSGLLKRLEPLLIDALVPELAVEALDAAILHATPLLNQDMPDCVPRLWLRLYGTRSLSLSVWIRAGVAGSLPVVV